jgi:hypothetical protein
VKTTLEIPDPIFRRAKSVAAERGIPFREIVTEAFHPRILGEKRALIENFLFAFLRDQCLERGDYFVPPGHHAV